MIWLFLTILIVSCSRMKEDANSSSRRLIIAFSNPLRHLLIAFSYTGFNADAAAAAAADAAQAPPPQNRPSI